MTCATRVAYISRVSYPAPTANALQSLHMAGAFAARTGDACFFVHDLASTPEALCQQYGLGNTPLHIWPLRTRRWPAVVHRSGRARSVAYNAAVSAILAAHPRWRRAAAMSVLFVRSRMEILYWGLMRRYLPWLRGWTFVCEVHDLQLPLRDSARGIYDDRAPRAVRFTNALRQYDLVIAVTNGLAADVRQVTQGSVAPIVVPMTSGLPRIGIPPVINLTGRPITIGYIGRINRAHGVDDVIRALPLLPGDWQLRLVGTVDDDDRGWLSATIDAAGAAARVQALPAVEYAKVAAQIDACDLVVAPAGLTRHSQRHRSPLKLFDYMARGKPIVAADVPCHRELLTDGCNARLYRRGSPESLAAAIREVTQRPELARAIARGGWEGSAADAYPRRAARILDLAAAARF